MLTRFLRRFQRKTPNQYQPVILVTGCSSGIGLALARELAEISAYRVVATARVSSVDKMSDAGLRESDRFLIRALDVTSAEEREKLIGEIGASWGGIDILVNNAGISYRAVVEHMNDRSERHQLETNYLGPMALIRSVLPFMREKGRGKIINVSSVAGMLAMPTMASYSASKHALEGASEALWYEMRPLGINVSLIQPGFVHSASFQNVYRSGAEAPLSMPDAYHDYYENMEPFIGRLMNLSRATPSSIAKLILKVIRTESPPLWVPATVDAVVFYYIRRLLPRRFLHPVLFALLPGARNWARSYSHRRPR